MDGDDFSRCVEVLADDAARAGKVGWADVVRVATARGLADALPEILDALTDLDIVVSDAPIMTADRAPATGTDGGALPAMLRSHLILTADVEVVLGRRIHLGLAASQKVDLEEREPSAQEAALIADGKRARDELVLANIRLAASVAKRYTHRCGDMEFDDLLQEGIKGLHTAARKFDPELGFKFSTYATWWIRQGIERAIDDTASIIRLPVHLWTEVRRVQTYARAFEVRNGRSATLAELAHGVGEDPARVRAMLDWATPVARLDATVGDEGDATLGDFALVDTDPGPEESVIESDVAVGLRRRIEDVLDPRSRHIIQARFGFDGREELTLEAIGAELGITRERVRQIESKIFERLRRDEEVRALARVVLGRAA